MSSFQPEDHKKSLAEWAVSHSLAIITCLQRTNTRQQDTQDYKFILAKRDLLNSVAIQTKWHLLLQKILLAFGVKTKQHRVCSCSMSPIQSGIRHYSSLSFLWQHFVWAISEQKAPASPTFLKFTENNCPWGMKRSPGIPDALHKEKCLVHQANFISPSRWTVRTIPNRLIMYNSVEHP